MKLILLSILIKHLRFLGKVKNFYFDILKIILPLHSQNIGLVAQLNSASDYGSEGYWFESSRGHGIKN
jgi:hypothetical protein